jgi:hypothetical protein
MVFLWFSYGFPFSQQQKTTCVDHTHALFGRRCFPGAGNAGNAGNASVEAGGQPFFMDRLSMISGWF